nr:MAG TPA: hypothetical protein [Caudoviricetes sp.]
MIYRKRRKQVQPVSHTIYQRGVGECWISKM